MPTNAPSYASPQTSGQVRRSQYLADAIRQLQQTPKDVYNTAEGTNYNILANAILGYQANQAENRADRMLADDKTRVADMIRGQFPDQQGVTQNQLNADKPFDLTPTGNQQRAQEAGIGNLASMIFETTGDPTAAINAGMGQKRQMLEDQRYADEQKYARGRDTVADNWRNKTFEYQQGRDAIGDNQWQQGFNQNADQFGQTMGFQNKQLGETIRHNKAGEENDAARVAAAAGPLGKQTPMQQAVDKNWADDLVDWAANGSSNFVKNMSQLQDGITRLKSGEELSGPGTTALVGPLRDWWGQAGKEVQQQIQEVVQTSLKQVLGSQFTAKEGEGIMARTFDPTLEEGVNAARAERLMAQMQIAAEQKNAATTYFNQHGTMQGYTGHIPSIDDFNAAVDSVGGGSGVDFSNPQLAQGAPEMIAEVWSRATPAQRQNLYDSMTPEQRGMLPKKQTGSSQIAAFMQTLPPELQDPDLIARIEATLNSGGSGAQPSVEDLVNKYRSR